MSYGHMTPAEMGTYSCSFDYATSSYVLNAFDSEPVYKIKFVSVDIIPDKDGKDNRRGILIKWTLPLVDPCWSSNMELPNDPGLTDEERDNFENGNNADRGGLSKEEYLIELQENCRRRSVNCRAKDEDCISLDNLRVHFYLAIIPYLSVPYRTIEISGLNKRRLTNYSKEDILDLLVTNETDCEHGVACHVERGFHKSRCETITDELAKQECNLFVANGMMKYTCGCASFHDIVHEDIKPSIKTQGGGEIALEPSKPESNQRKLARSTKYIVKIHAEKLMTETNDNHQRIEQIIHSTEPATFVTPTLDLNALRAPEIERVLPIADYSTFYLRESLIASSMTKRKIRASICWHKTSELVRAREVDEQDGVLSKNAVHAYRCHDFDITKREIRIGPFEASTKFMAYVEVTVEEGEMITDKSLIKQFETDDYIRNPNSPLGLESFSMIPSSGGMSYRWEEPYAEANQYIRMTTWNGTEQVVYRFNPGEATVTKKCDEPRKQSEPRKSRHRNAITRRCYHKFKYTKPTAINIPVSNRTSIRSYVEMFDFRNIQSNIKHAVFLANTTTRNELEQTVLPPCSMIGGEWESSNKVRLEWNCPPVSLSLPHGEKSYKTRSKENSIAELLAGLPKAKDNLYFHIRWTTDLWSQNDTGWFIPYNKVVNHDRSYKYNVTQDNTNTLSPTKTFEKILNECQVLNFQVRLIFFPTSPDRPHSKCLVNVGDSYGSIHKTRRLIDGQAGDVNCREYAGSPFSDTLSLQITPQDTLLPPEYEYSYIKNDRITLTTVKKLSHDCRQHYIQVQIRVKDKNRVENANDQPVEQQQPQQEESSSRQKKNESDGKETYKFPPDVYHSCYTLTSNKEETFRFDQFTRGEEKGSTSFNNLPLDSSSVYEIAIRRGRGQNNIETDMNTCSNYKEGQHSQWTEWIEMPMPLSKSTTTSTNVTPTQSSTSEPSTAAKDECWLHKKFQYSCDVTDILLVVVAVLVLLLLLMFIYILYKSNCWCQTHDHDCNGNLPILNNTPKYIKTEFTQRPPNNDHNNRYEESAGLLLQRTTHEDTNNELSNSTLELNKGPSMTDLDVRSVPIRRSIQHRQPNLIQPTPQMISKQSNYQQYEENVQQSLPKDTNQTCGSLESPLIPPHLPEKQTNLEEKSEETDSFPSSNSSLYCDPKEKLIHSQTTILAPSQVLAALETTT